MAPLLCHKNHSNICNHNRYNSKFDLSGKTGSPFKKPFVEIHKPLLTIYRPQLKSLQKCQ